MAAIITNPRKTKPAWLEYPCSICDKYEESEKELDGMRKALWGNQTLRSHFNCCRFDPLLAAVNDANQCPYNHLRGKTIIGLKCDNCGKEFALLSPEDPNLPNLLADPFQIHLCDDCQKLPEKQLTMKPPIPIFSSKQKEDQ
jgi:hypothetical protein